MADRLVPTNSNSAIVKDSTAFAEVAKGLDLAAGLWPRDLTERVIEFWKQEFSRYKPEHVKRAFEEHCGNEDFFPTPNQIKLRIREYIADEAPGPAAKIREQMKQTSRQITE